MAANFRQSSGIIFYAQRTSSLLGIIHKPSVCDRHSRSLHSAYAAPNGIRKEYLLKKQRI